MTVIQNIFCSEMHLISYEHRGCRHKTGLSKSQKKVSERKQGMEPSKTSQTRWERHHNTFTPSLHLVLFCQLCFVFVSCVHRRVVELVEGSGEGSAGCVVHVNVHGECVMLWVAAM